MWSGVGVLGVFVPGLVGGVVLPVDGVVERVGGVAVRVDGVAVRVDGVALRVDGVVVVGMWVGLTSFVGLVFDFVKTG